ncbi:MAG: SURF1 family protein [Alphaproteobacteria bacterium]|nr:SURF1 family protein [Alphaproteobacteria bacterium]
MTDTGSGERTFRCGRWRLPLWATVFAGGAIVAMLALSLWQVERLEWKDSVIAERKAALKARPIPLPSVIEAAEDWDFRRVTATGVFDHDRETYLGARSLNGNLGYHVLTPLRRSDGTDVIVDRGWIPLRSHDRANRPGSLTAGEITVAGVARTTGKRGWLTPEDSPEEEFWFVVDIDAIGRHLELKNVVPVYIEAGRSQSVELPIGGQTRWELPNDHLQYAITWFCLAVALAVIYVVYVRRLNAP